jgi:alpha-L-rhamnosidase
MRDTRRRFLLQMGAAPLITAAARAQTEKGDLLRRTWTAKWISVPNAPATEYGVYHFRHTVELPSKPARFVIHVTADQRYRLFVNGKSVAWGPARGDLFHWRYETLDIAPFLDAGKNVLAAEVWNFGDLAPEAQVTLQTGFLLQGDTADERVADTGARWKCLRNRAYKPIEFSNADMHGYYVVGPGDRVTAAEYPWGWEQKDFDDGNGWEAAVALGVAAGREASDPHSRWMLVRRNIPAMEERAERLQKVRRAEGVPAPASFPAEPEPVVIPADTRAVLLLDQTWLTAAYPELTLSGGKDATIRMRYAESLFAPFKKGSRDIDKGDRGAVDGKVFIGNHDEFVADGGKNRTFRPLWWRTYRYLELVVETKEQPVTIDDLRATAVGFPFERRAKFESTDPELNRILDVGWRTARMCAHETYMDCPYYEQLQYVGDTRVQCLVSLFNSGDPRLMRNAIDQINDSRQSDGCTMSRYPTRLEQYIPAFSLWWIGMVRDYWWYVDDPAFVRRMLPGVRAVLSFFEGYQKANGSLASLPWWRYFDWVKDWKGGAPPAGEDGSTAEFDLLHLMALGWASEMETALGLRVMADVYRDRAAQLRQTIQKLYWDAEGKLYSDTPNGEQFSQHTNTLAVLAGLVPVNDARSLMRHTLEDADLAQAGLFFRFYMHQALALAGEGDTYLEQLDDWREMLAHGLTTFAEVVDEPGKASRSDCHAWSASPNIEIFRTVLGVDSAAPGFKKVAVRPHLGKLKMVSGSVPHPKGAVIVRVEKKGTGFEAVVSLPADTTGTFLFAGVTRDLVSGENRITG